MFTKTFDGYVSDGDVIQCEVDGFDCFATIHADDCRDAPWDNEDGHGPVSEWVTRDKRPGELVLNEDGRRHGKSYRYYDYAEACRIALADGWGMAGGRKEGESARAYAARAARHDFEVLKAFCNNEWAYYGVEIAVYKAEVKLTGNFDHTMWGLEGNFPGGDNSHFADMANDLLPGALDAARAKIEELVEA